MRSCGTSGSNSATLSRSVAENSRVSCVTMPKRSRSACRSHARRSRPSIAMLPESGVYSPASSRASVDLPEPEAPTIATHSPAATSKLMSASTGRGSLG